MTTTALMFLIILSSGSVGVIGGEVELPSGEKMTIGKGTFIPSPWDEELAKSILDYRSEIKYLRLELEKKEDKFDMYVNKSREREDIMKDYYQDKYKDVYLKNIILEGPWNKYGKTILVSVIVGAAAIVSTWFICSETDKLGC